MKSTGDPSIDALYKVPKGKVEFVDVPELGFLVIDGGGDPSGDAFHDAIQALYSVSYGVHFAPIDTAVIEQAIIEAKAKKDIASLSAVRYERWEEGPSAQIMHIGPYA